MLARRKKYFSNEKPRMTKQKLNLKNWKSPKMAKYQGLGFSNSNFFVICGFPSKTFLFLKANIVLSHQNNFEDDSINREEDIL